MCFGSNETKTESKEKLPKWVEEGGKQNFAEAKQVAARPYEAYGGTRVADQTADQRAGLETIKAGLMEHMAGGGNPLEYMMQYAGKGATRVNMGGDLSGPAPNVGTSGVMDESGVLGKIRDYMSPYLEGVLGPQVRGITEQGARERQSIDSSANMAGAFGDARHGVAEGMQRQNEMRQVSDATGQAYQSAYQDAISNRQQDLGRYLQADTTNAGMKDSALSRLFQGRMADAGYDESALERMFKGAGGIADLESQRLTDILKGGTTLATLGEQERGVQQKKLDTEYQKFLEGRDWDRNTIDWLSSVLTMQPYGKTTTNTTTTPDNTFAQIGGAVLGAIL